MNIYVGNLPYSLSSDELRTVFEDFGQVKSAEIIIDRRTQRSRGYGFVQMMDDASAKRAIEALDGAEYKGRNLRVDASNNQSEVNRQPQPRHAPRRSLELSSNTGAAVGGVHGQGVFGFLRRIFG
jgi:RNA recognition motif-containing protein